MHFLGDYAVINYCSIQFLSMLFNVSLQAILILGLGYALIALFKFPQETIHLILFLSLLSFLLIPLFFYGQTYLIDMAYPASFHESNGSLSIEPFTPSMIQFTLGPSAYSSSSSPVPFPQDRLHWSFWILVLWGSGVMIGFFHIMMGTVSLRHIIRNAVPCRDEDSLKLVKTLSCQLGIARKVRLVESDDVRVPVTCYSLFPVIILPHSTELTKIPGGIAMILVHELMHIKRWDCLSQLLSRIVCVFFWFNPLVWYACSHQKAAQEKACDGDVIRSGISSVDYARMLVDLVRRLPSRITFSEAALLDGKSALEQRIRHILNRQRHSRCILSQKMLSIISLLGVLSVSFCNPVFSLYDESSNLDMLRNALRTRQQFRYVEFPDFLKRRTAGAPIAWPVFQGKGTHSWGKSASQHDQTEDDGYPLAYWLDIYWNYPLQVIATENGIVIEVEQWSTQRLHIKIAHNHQYYTIYNDLSPAKLLVHVGQTVKKGDVIGYMAVCIDDDSKYKMRYIIQHNVLSMNPYAFLYLWGPRLYFDHHA